MNRLVIHRGTEKAGSKALQIALRTGSGKGYIYPDQGNGAVLHIKINDALAATPPNPDPLDAALAQIGGAPLGVISHEGLHSLPNCALDLLAERARAWGRETLAVVFLRRLLAARGPLYWLARAWDEDGPTGPLDLETAERILLQQAASNERVRALWFPERAQLFPAPAPTPHQRTLALPRWDVVWRVGWKFGI